MRTPTRPLLVILSINNIFYAGLVNPAQRIICYRDLVKGTGPNHVLGILQDQGYAFSKISVDVPKWILRITPTEYTIFGIANITNFPFK